MRKECLRLKAEDGAEPRREVEAQAFMAARQHLLDQASGNWNCTSDLIRTYYTNWYVLWQVVS